MPVIEKHRPGSFCWIELATTDQNAAKSFYGSLFGWTANDNPMGPGEYYTIFNLKGREVAAGYTLRQDQRARGVPVHWSLYVAVENADQTAGKAAQAGATILMPPFDVMDAGRMAVLHDPTGAVFSIWEPKKSQGIGIHNEPGALCWADLMTPDSDRATKFYSRIFGWEFTKDPKDPSGYLHLKNGDDYIGGVPPAQYFTKGITPHWQIYFLVSDVAASVAKASSMGARIVLPQMDMPGVGTWAVLSDPQGAVFSVFKSAR